MPRPKYVPKHKTIDQPPRHRPQPHPSNRRSSRRQGELVSVAEFFGGRPGYTP